MKLTGRYGQVLELCFRMAFDQQRDEVAQWPAVESGVHIVDNASHGRGRDRWIPMGEARDHLIYDRLFAQLDHPRSLTRVNRAVN